jgi:hypothetical protein
LAWIVGTVPSPWELCCGLEIIQFSQSFLERQVDGLNTKGRQDGSKVNVHESHEVKYRTKQLNASNEELQRVVYKVGNGAAAVRKQLAD